MRVKPFTASATMTRQELAGKQPVKIRRNSAVITSYYIVECKNIPENEKKQESYECLALQNTGIVNQISLSCQTQTNNASDEEIYSLQQTIPQSTPKPEPTNTPDAAVQATVLEREHTIPNAFKPDIENTTYGVEQPKDFKDAF